MFYTVVVVLFGFCRGSILPRLPNNSSFEGFPFRHLNKNSEKTLFNGLGSLGVGLPRPETNSQCAFWKPLAI